MNHPFSRGNIKTVFATTTRKLLIHSFIFFNSRQCVSILSSRCSHSAGPVPHSIHLHFHATTFSGLYHTADPSIEPILSPRSDFLLTFLHPAVTCSFFSYLHPPTHTPVLWILEPHVPFSSSAPKFYPSSSIKH